MWDDATKLWLHGSHPLPACSTLSPSPSPSPAPPPAPRLNPFPPPQELVHEELLKIAEAAAPRDLGRFPALQRRLATAVLEYIQVGGGHCQGLGFRVKPKPPSLS